MSAEHKDIKHHTQDIASTCKQNIGPQTSTTKRCKQKLQTENGWIKKHIATVVAQTGEETYTEKKLIRDVKRQGLVYLPKRAACGCSLLLAFPKLDPKE